MGYVDKALSAHLKSTLHAGFTSMSEKVADITQADTAKHTITLAELGLPANVVCLVLGATRVSGAGDFQVYPSEGASALSIGTPAVTKTKVISIINERLEYNLTTANDDFDLYCFGYWTSGRVAG